MNVKCFIATVFACITLPIVTNAQVYVGYKNGASLWLTKSGYGAGSRSLSKEQSPTSEKEISIRIGLNRNLIIEHGIQYYVLNRVSKDQSYRDEQVLQKNTNIQYDITNHFLGYVCPFFRQLKSFSGVNFSPRLHISNNTYYTTLMMGISYTHQFPITDKIIFCSQYSYQVSVFDNKKIYTGDIPYNNRRISYQASIFYALR